MIAASDREQMLAVPMCGERVVERLASIGVRSLADLRRRDPWDLMHEINLEAGRAIWQPPMAIIALQNLVDASEREGTNPPARDA
jgi:hypothetical protein